MPDKYVLVPEAALLDLCRIIEGDNAPEWRHRSARLCDTDEWCALYEAMNECIVVSDGLADDIIDAVAEFDLGTSGGHVAARIAVLDCLTPGD